LQRSAPEPLAALELRLDLLLKLVGAEGIAVVAAVIDERTPLALGEILEPAECLLLGPIAGRDGDIDAHAAPEELRRQQHQARLVRPHPFRQRARRLQPAADEGPAGVGGMAAIDGAAAAAAEGTGLPGIDLVLEHLDAERAGAAGEAAAALAGHARRGHDAASSR